MSFENQYGKLDRVLHRFAFKTLIAQEALADLEDGFFRKEIRSVEVVRPVFISALPRAGTTVLLNLLSSTGEFATHTYRDMPFILCPLFWKRFSRHFAVDSNSRERAHGDGVLVSVDSPESFEEVVWKRFWPEHYPVDRIEPWSAADMLPDFDEFFLQHIRKVIVARRTDRASNLRYLSKNNVTIARLAALPGPLRQGLILIPFRDPIQQAASLLNQHRRFLDVHSKDDFARRYVTDVGHCEFGLAHRPINFLGWLEHVRDTEALEYWLRYWTAAYRHVIDSLGANVLLVSYAELTEQPKAVLSRIASWIGVDPDGLTRQANQLRQPHPHQTDRADLDSSVLAEARRLYDELREIASRPSGDWGP